MKQFVTCRLEKATCKIEKAIVWKGCGRARGDSEAGALRYWEM